MAGGWDKEEPEDAWNAGIRKGCGQDWVGIQILYGCGLLRGGGSGGVSTEFLSRSYKLEQYLGDVPLGDPMMTYQGFSWLCIASTHWKDSVFVTLVYCI